MGRGKFRPAGNQRIVNLTSRLKATEFNADLRAGQQGFGMIRVDCDCRIVGLQSFFETPQRDERRAQASPCQDGARFSADGLSQAAGRIFSFSGLQVEQAEQMECLEVIGPRLKDVVV